MTASAPIGTPLLRCAALEIGHGGRALLPPIDLTVCTGELWTVIGRNGAGKTTFFRTLLGLQPPVRGKVEHLISPLRLAYVPQRATYDDLHPMRARDVVALGVERGASIWRPRWTEPPEVTVALKHAEAADLGDRPFRTLSEGQKQRILIARILASGAQLALLDEPTAAMDVVAERHAFRSLQELRSRHGIAVIVVSHFLAAVRDVADRALLLDRERGAVVAGTAADVLGHGAYRHSFDHVDAETADRESGHRG